MPTDVYGGNPPTFLEFFGPIAGPVIGMLLMLAAVAAWLLRPKRTPRTWDSFIWLGTGTFISLAFMNLRKDCYGCAKYEFGATYHSIGFVAFVWLLTVAGWEFSWLRMKKTHGPPSNLLATSVTLCFLFCVFVCVAPETGDAREGSSRTYCKNNLKQIGLALHNYHDNFDRFPPQQFGDPPQSWRVAVLPWVDQVQLFNEYHRDQPWDSPANSEFSRRAIGTYLCLSQKHIRDEQGRFLTSYAVMFGPHGIWGDDRLAVPLGKIRDGTSHTIAVIEACGQNIVWNEPRDLDGRTTPAAINLPGPTRRESPAMASSLHVGGAHVLLADGSVRFISEKTDPQTLRALVTVDGDELVGDW